MFINKDLNESALGSLYPFQNKWRHRRNMTSNGGKTKPSIDKWRPTTFTIPVGYGLNSSQSFQVDFWPEPSYCLDLVTRGNFYRRCRQPTSVHKSGKHSLKSGKHSLKSHMRDNSFLSGLPLFQIEVCKFLSDFSLCPGVKPL